MKEKAIERYKYLIGTTIGLLTIKELYYNRRGRSVDLMAKCVCHCGVKKSIRVESILKGITVSCGCKKIKHRLIHHKLYSVWTNMRNRCYNKNVYAYRRYGGRGIRVCDEWRTDFKKFYEWAIENGWNEDLQMDRIDNNGNYCPENCRFVTPVVNVHNREMSEIITYDGRTLNISDWAEIIGCSVSGLHNRIYRGWDIKRAIETPFKKPAKRRLLTYGGITRNMHQWENVLNFPRGTISNRIRIGWSIEKTLTTPCKRNRE